MSGVYVYQNNIRVNFVRWNSFRMNNNENVRIVQRSKVHVYIKRFLKKQKCKKNMRKIIEIKNCLQK